MRARAIAVIAAVTLVVLNIPPVAADTSYAFTSTAQFDSGDKSYPGDDFFVANGVDQPTYSVSKPAAVYVASVQRTYVVYQGEGGFLPHITYYSHATGLWASPVIVNDSNPVQGDGHGAPALWVDSTGYLYVFFGAHATSMQLRRSVSPHVITSWVSLASPTPLPVPGNQASYPHLFSHGGYIYFFYRQGTAGGDGVWGFRRSNDRGDSWSAYTTILDFRTDGAYVSDHVYVAAQSRLYYNFVWDERVAILRHNVYVCYWDLTTNTQFGINGVNLGPVVSLAEADANCRAVNTGLVGQCWFSAMKLDASNRPHVLYVNGTDAVYNDYNTSYVRWTGSAWTVPEKLVGSQTDGTSSYMDLRVNSDTDIDGYVVTHGFRQLSGNEDYSGDLELWHYNGTAWSFVRTIMSEANAGNPVNRPFRPLNAASPIEIIFDSWNPKDGLQPEARMWAWSQDTGFVYRHLLNSATLGTQTITDNPSVAGGSFVLTNGQRDEFATDDADAVTGVWSNIKTGDGAGDLVRQFEGDAYNVSATDTGTTGRLGATLRGNFGVSGSIDFRIRTDLTDTPETGNTFAAICLFTQPDECDVTSGDYYFATEGVYHVYLNSAAPTQLDAVKRVGGVLTGIGTTSAPVCEPCWLRITKVGTVFTFWYSVGGSTWVQDETEDIVALDDSVWYVHVSLFTNGVNSGDWAMEADKYALVNGTLVGGYQPAGSWRAPEVVWAGRSEVVKNVTVTYSGASNDSYIDSVSVIDPDSGEVLFTDDTNVVSGSSVFFDVGSSYAQESDLTGHDFVVQVRLAGDHSGSPLITAVSFNTVRPAALVFLDKAIDIFWLVVFVLLCVGAVTGAYIVGKWRGV